MASDKPIIPSKIYIPEKTIRLPLCGLIDVSGMLPILNHILLQLLLERKQLGLAFKVFPGATHTRLEHSLGTLHIVRKFIRHFGITDEALIHALEVAALIHDIGHGPFSHEFELVAPHDHKDEGWHRFEQLRDEIAQYADVALVEQLYRREHPLHCLIHDRNFGADKLDYLQRDSYHVGYELALNDSSLISYLQFKDGVVGIDQKSKEEMMAYQFSYLRMYSVIYFQKTVKIFARMLQRALCNCCGSPAAVANLYDCTDTQLLNHITSHVLAPRITNRGPFKTVHVFKIAGYEVEERIGNRAYRVTGIHPEQLKQWSLNFIDPWKLIRIEDQLSEALGLPASHALIVQPGFPDKLVPLDVNLYRFGKDTFASLFEQVPTHPRNLREMMDRHFYMLVAVPQEDVARVASFNFAQFFTELSI